MRVSIKNIIIWLILIAILVAGFFAIFWVLEDVKNQSIESSVKRAEDIQLSTAKLFAQGIESQVNQIRQELEAFALVTELTQDPEACNEKLAAIQAEVNESGLPLSNLARVNTDGIFFCAGVESSVGTDASSFPYIRKILDTDQHPVVVSNAFLVGEAPSQRIVMAIHVPVYDEEGQFAGSLGGAFYTDQIVERALVDLKIGKGGWVVLLDKNGDVLHHPNPELLGENLYGEKVGALLSQNQELGELMDRALELDSGQMRYYSVQGGYNTGSFNHVQVLPEHNWSSIMTIPLAKFQEDAEQSVSVFQRVLLLVYGVISALLLVAVSVFVYIRRTSAERHESAQDQLKEDLRDKETELESLKKQVVGLQEDADHASGEIGKLKDINSVLMKLHKEEEESEDSEEI